MFNTTLQQILKRQTYIDQLNDNQISTIKTKQLFFKAQEQEPIMDPFNQNEQIDEQKKIFRSPHIDSPAINLLKHILPAPQNSYEQIQQLENRMSLFNQKKLNQIEIIKSLFENQKEDIINSGLTVSDFLQIYLSEDMQNQQKDINDSLVKKIMAYFQTNKKQHSFYDLMKMIIDGLPTNQVKIEQQQPQFKAMRKLRQSVCFLQGLKINFDEDDSRFNEQTKKQMDKILDYYRNILTVFDIQGQQ